MMSEIKALFNRKLWLDAMKLFIENQLLIFNYYSKVVYDLQIYFKCKTNCSKYKYVQLYKPANVYVALTLNVIFLSMFTSFVLFEDFNYKKIPIAVLIEILPFYGRIYFVVIFQFWCSMLILYPVYVLKNDIHYYMAYSVFVVNNETNSKILPKNLGMSHKKIS